MAVRRENAVVNQELDLRVDFRFDRTGNLFDPDTVVSVQIYDENYNLIETITSITKISQGYYQVIASPISTAQTVRDKWNITWKSNSYSLTKTTIVRETAAPSIGMQSFVNLTKLKVQAPTIGLVKLVDPDDYQTLILEAVKEYSRRRPQRLIQALVGDGKTYFLVSGLTDWEHKFSKIENIEYPLDEHPPKYLQQKQYKYERIPAGLAVRFLESPYPGLNDNFWVRYSVRHVVDDASSTVPEADKDGVCNLAASLCCQALAEAFGQTSDASLDADVVAYRTRGDEFQARANRLREIYEHVIKPEVTGIIDDWDPYFYEKEEPLLRRESVI